MTQDEMNALMTERFELEAAGEVDWQARAEAAEARVAELEQGWRPVTDDIPREVTIELILPVKVSADDDNALYYHADSGAFIGYLNPGETWRTNLAWRPAPPQAD